MIADFDFEAYSEAGFDFAAGRWRPVGNAQKGGLPAVGAAVYAEHPSTEVLSLAYDLKDGRGKRLWVPGLPAPLDLFAYLATGQPIEAHNAMFEYWIWQRVCHERYGWPRLPITPLRDSAAKCRAYGLPGALGKAAIVMGTTAKIADGDRLIKKFSVPRNPTKADKRLRIRPEDDPADAMNLYVYNLGDIEAEAELSAAVPDLPPDELEFWHATMAMNERGVAIDLAAVESAIAILEQAYVKYDTELAELTGGAVDAASKVQALRGWLAEQGVHTRSLDDEAITGLLEREDLTPQVRRALEIRSAVGSAGVKKVYAMKRRACRDGRVKDLFIYHGARTGRDTGADVQPQNLVKAGVKIRQCSGCGKYCGAHNDWCPHCNACIIDVEVSSWSHEATDDVIETLHTRSLAEVERVWGDAALAISGCIRGLFIADDGKELICSDYSSIEAVVTAMLAGEEWRIEAFRQKKDIYLTSAAKITGHSYEWYMENGGKSHPDRQKVGKPAELALGFGGWIGAWRQFDKSDNWTDDQVKTNINAWREASPMIVEFWGGQKRGKPWENGPTEFYGLEGAAIKAVMRPGETFSYRLISYVVENDVLFAILPSGRRLAYHKPRLRPSTKREGELQLSYMTWNSNPKMGALGWVEMETYGGRLTENVVQAVARDIMAHAVPRLERAGYPVVLRVHDEVASEVPIGYGSIEEFEQIMADLPEWAKDWPIRAAGGWRGKRYRKD